MIMNEVRAVDQRNLSLGNDKSETLHGSGHGSSVGTIIEPMVLHITQDPTVFEGKTPCLTQGNPKTGQATVGVAIPIADKATRYKGGGSTRNNDGSANGLGIGEPGAPANTLTAADRHGVACFAQQAIGEYEESEKASCLKRRDYKDSTDLILWEYIIRRLTPWNAADCKASQITGQRNWGHQNQRRKISITGEMCSERRWKPWARAKRKRQTTRSANG